MSPKDMAKHLLANLAGEPLNKIATLTPEQKTDYKAGKNRLLEHFGKSEEHNRKLFRDIRLHKNGDYNRIIFEIKQNILKWLELSNCDMKKPDEIIDMFLIDSVLLNVTDNVFTFLKEKKIKNETELITNLNLFKDSHPNHTIDRRDYQVAATINTDSSKLKYSSNNRTCFNCGIKGHIKSQCRSNNRITFQYRSDTYRDNKYDNRRNSRATQSYSPNDRRRQYNTNNDNYNFQNYQRRQQYNTNNNFQNYQRRQQYNTNSNFQNYQRRQQYNTNNNFQKYQRRQQYNTNNYFQKYQRRQQYNTNNNFQNYQRRQQYNTNNNFQNYQRRQQYNTNNNFQNYQRRQQYNTNNNFQNYHRQSRRDGYERNRYNRNTLNRWQSNSNNRIQQLRQLSRKPRNSRTRTCSIHELNSRQ
uniref:CCHC-type domain-containing protein n=1 Tax=Biomphalaria glabrata TaxID=6526 RepID=A0A2C9LJI1_BIOGL